MSIRTLSKETKIRKGLNIAFPLKRSTFGAFKTNDTTLDAVRDDLRMLLITNWGERLINYDFGANLRSIIFEQRGSETKQKIEDAINVAVEKWIPYVNILDMQIKDQNDDAGLGDNEVKIKISFQVGQSGLESVLEQKIQA